LKDILKPSIGYMQWHAEAERRSKAGERQVQCPKCKLWTFLKWPADVADHDRRCAAVAAFNAASAEQPAHRQKPRQRKTGN
jgi:hypothetical protein